MTPLNADEIAALRTFDSTIRPRLVDVVYDEVADEWGVPIDKVLATLDAASQPPSGDAPDLAAALRAVDPHEQFYIGAVQVNATTFANALREHLATPAPLDVEPDGDRRIRVHYEVLEDALNAVAGGFPADEALRRIAGHANPEAPDLRVYAEQPTTEETP